jgi:hypothetical protein
LANIGEDNSAHFSPRDAPERAAPSIAADEQSPSASNMRFSCDVVTNHGELRRSFLF